MGFKALKAAGIPYQTAYGSKERRRVTRVQLRWNKDWWADVANKEGEFLPACCANISGVRDRLISAMREDEWITVDDLATCYYTLKDHDGSWEALFTNEEAVGFGPIAYLIRVWRAVKDVASVRTPERGLDPKDLKDATHIVASGTFQLDWEGLFDNGPDKCPQYKDRVARALLLARMIPAMHTLYHRLVEKALGDTFEGVAIVSFKRPNEVLKLGDQHLAIFSDQAAAEKVIKDAEEATPNVRKNIKMRPVRVTIADGLTFLDVAAEQPAA